MSHFVNSTDIAMDSSAVNGYSAIDFGIVLKYLVNKSVNWPRLGNFSVLLVH